MMNPVHIFQRLRKQKDFKTKKKSITVYVTHFLRQDDDLLSDESKIVLRSILGEVKSAEFSEDSDYNSFFASMEEKISPYVPGKSFSNSMCGFLDVLVVAVSVAFGIRALFLQPFQIPTGSMQPTLFGIHYIDAEESRKYRDPITNIFFPFSVSAAELTANEGGVLRAGFSPFTRAGADNLTCLFHPSTFYFSAPRVVIGNTFHTLPGKNVRQDIYRYLDMNPEYRFFRKGQTVFRGFLSTGDRLFVDRFSIHFSPLKRGEIFVFNTEGLRSSKGSPLIGFYYIKRLVGLPGDTLKIRNRILHIRPKGCDKFVRADEIAPSMKKIYSCLGGYQGHVNTGLLAAGREFTVPDECYFALGDNTRNSLDSRDWGVVPRKNIVGRSFMVFWPISRRWGFTDKQEPLPEPTRIPLWTTIPTAMRMQ